MFKNILVALDGSDHANKALSLATDLASKYGARLTIFHAYLRDASIAALRKLANVRQLTSAQRKLLDDYETEMMTLIASSGEFVPYDLPAPREIVEVVGRQILDRAEKEAKKARIKKIETMAVYGEPAEAVLRVAKKKKCDMIVLGSRGLGNFKGLLLGSVSHKVSSRAHCTCVAVK